MDLRIAAQQIIDNAIHSALPDNAVNRAIDSYQFDGPVHLVAIGKAAWQMANAAAATLGDRISDGIVITKYGHAKGPIGNLDIREAGHPVPDNHSYEATRAAINLVEGLTEEDIVLFLVSGGGSALFECPLISEQEMASVTDQLLASGADIREMNMIRKRLSAVKGGRFGEICAPAKVFSVVLSDIIGDPLDSIASGPAYPDSSTSEQVLDIVESYHLSLSDTAMEMLLKPLPRSLPNVETVVTGSVRQLCKSAAETCTALGFEPIVLTAEMCCTARDAGSFLGSIASFHQHTDHPLAYICGGETVVRISGNGKGGRNQELALSSAELLDGIPNSALFSVGSDGTDGPTDAAGGYVDGNTANLLRSMNISIRQVLSENDSYHALEKVNGLIMTGPTGTNVNDLSVLLIDKRE